MHCDHYAISPDQLLLKFTGVFSSGVKTVVPTDRWHDLGNKSSQLVTQFNQANTKIILCSYPPWIL